MNGLADKLLGLIGLGSLFTLPILVGIWLFCPKNRREPEHEPEPKVEVSVTVVKRSVFISTCSPSTPGTRDRKSVV